MLMFVHRSVNVHSDALPRIRSGSSYTSSGTTVAWWVPGRVGLGGDGFHKLCRTLADGVFVMRGNTHTLCSGAEKRRFRLSAEAWSVCVSVDV